VRRSSGLGNRCPASAAFMCPKSQKSECAKSGLQGRWGTPIIEFSAKTSQKPLSGGRDSCHDANLASENAVCDRLEILRAALIPKYNQGSTVCCSCAAQSSDRRRGIHRFPQIMIAMNFWVPVLLLHILRGIISRSAPCRTMMKFQSE
jgi:hypothetical protein